MSSIISSSTSLISNTNRSINISNENTNEEDQLNRINLQALQNRDPYITKIIDQAQRVCVYKFIGEKREWERKDLEGTLFVYERSCEPYHGFVILSTVSRETFVQIIKSSMEFKHSPNYEAFLQYKVDVGDIYGIWFISKNDCPRVTECLKRLTIQTKEYEQSKQNQLINNFDNQNLLSTLNQSSSDIFSLLINAQEKFQETKRKQEMNNTDTITSMPAALLRIFSTQDTQVQLTNNDEREQELKKTLGILGKPALSVTELEKQLLQPSSLDITKAMANFTGNNNNYTIENLVKPVQIENKTSIQTSPHSISPRVVTNSTNDWTTSNQNLFNGFDTFSNNNGRLMTPAEFQTLRITQSPSFIPSIQNDVTTSCCHCQNQQISSMNPFSKDTLRQLLIDMLQNDEEFLTGLHNAYTEKQNDLHRIYS
ncbi:unnamed protein product [Rotaria sp. Silwood1]|nr:unnamed protein product [Rotaria sp. Silwood1]CAF3391576.1 unnamed protein product [Rotaria sp. Silwood1]CAF3392126.1 unnamed protein product [Rotaria sp. Silwood1]CAF4612885.1 unnamed protein product [Rotaria sp. Silwood1]CAF4820331.1 unnamed protein product [Rotaria sp. Silwood1]